MSAMSELAYDIEQLYIEGFSPMSISAQLGCPIDLVYDWLESTGVAESQQEDFNPFETINS
jgi:hypothetical protein